MKDKLILVGPLPPPYHGQSLSFKMLFESLSEHHEVSIVNLADNDIDGNRGLRSILKRAVKYQFIFFNYLREIITGKCRIYLTISQSRQGFFRDFVMIWLAVLLRRPVVVHLKGGNYGVFYEKQPSWIRYLIRQTLLRTERILVLGKRLVNMYDFDPKLSDRIYVVENGLPYETPLPRVKSLVDGKTLELLFLSNLVESKGYFDVLDAIALLKESGVKIICHFAGQFYANSDDKKVESAEHAKELFYTRIAELDIQNNVVYHGVVSGESKEQLLQSSHIFLLPTRYNNEGQPVSIIEALAFGLPVVATDYRAIPDMLLESETGCFVDYGNALQIVDAVNYISNPLHYERLSESCIKLFSAKFTREAHLKRITTHILGRDIH